MSKKKSFNTELDDLLSNLDLPTDEEVQEETVKLKLKEAAKLTHSKRSSAWREALSNANSKKKDNKEFIETCKVAAQEKVSKKSWLENNKKQREALYKNTELQEKRQRNLIEANLKPEVRERKRKATQKAQGVQVEVMEPSGSIKKFPSAGEASRHYQWPTLSALPKESFPEDGSWKEWVGKNKRNSKRDGFKTRRI